MSIDLAALGITQAELQDRVIERVCEQLLTGIGYDPEGEGEFTTASAFHRQIQARIQAQITDTINAIAEREILPNVASFIENLILQETNSWGEKQGAPVTFIEYLVKRAEAYMQEKVDFKGMDKANSGSYSWTGTQTRITHLVHAHLHYSIETAMKEALNVATGSIAKGIHETARLKLNEIAASMKVQVATK